MDGTRSTRSDRNGRKRAGRGRPCRGPIAAQAGEGGHLSNGQSSAFTSGPTLAMEALDTKGSKTDKYSPVPSSAQEALFVLIECEDRNGGFG